MNINAEEYLAENFRKIKQIHKSKKSEIWLVYGRFDKQIYILKYLQQKGLPYKKIKGIQHKILPQIFYVNEDDSSTTVIEEYISGKTLIDFCKEKDFIDEGFMSEILQQLCAGLMILHENHIIHRDIKPSNLILTNDKIIKLIDFDAARIEKKDQANDTVYLGTKGYAPPEQYGFGQTDARSDIYALGVTIKTLLGSSYQGDFMKIINRCTKIDPNERFQNMAELCNALKNIKLPIFKAEIELNIQEPLELSLPSSDKYAFDKNAYSMPVLSSPQEHRYEYTSYKQAGKKGLIEFRDKIYSQRISIIRKVVIAYKHDKLMNFLKYEECNGNYKYELNKSLENKLRKYAKEIEADIGKQLRLNDNFFVINTQDSVILKDRLRYGVDTGWAERIASQLEPVEWFNSWIDCDDTTISVEKKRWLSQDTYYETKDMYCFMIKEAVQALNNQILNECQNNIIGLARQEIQWELDEYHRLLKEEWAGKIGVLLEKLNSGERESSI